MHTRLGGLLALAVALPLGLAPAAQATVGHPSAWTVPSKHIVTEHTSARAARPRADPHLKPLPPVSHGRAVAALHRAEHALTQPTPTRPGTGRLVERPVTDRSATLALRDLWVARRSLTGAERRTARGLLARPTETGRNETDPVSFTSDELNALQQRCSTHFCVTYTTARNAGQDVDGDPRTTKRWNNAATETAALTDLRTLEHVWSVEVDRLGYRPPLSDADTVSGTDTNANPKIDIYLVDLRPLGYYGYCAPDDLSPTMARQQSAYCVLDNDYADYGTTPTRALDVTAAHEFFHAVQFGYNLAQPKWFMEGSAVWMEDQVYDSINDYVQYVATSPIRQPLVPFTAPGNQYEPYGAFTVFTFLSSWLGTRDAVREAWAGAVSRSAMNAVTAVLRRHHRNVRTAFATFGLWNTLPTRSYPERVSYRPAGAWQVVRLTPRHRSTKTMRVRVHSLASAPAVFVPSRRLGGGSRLHLVLQAPRPRAGGAATVQVRWRSGKVRQVQLRLHRDGSLRFDQPFSPRRVRSVVVTLTNAATSGGKHVFRLAASVR